MSNRAWLCTWSVQHDCSSYNIALALAGYGLFSRPVHYADCYLAAMAHASLFVMCRCPVTMLSLRMCTSPAMASAACSLGWQSSNITLNQQEGINGDTMSQWNRHGLFSGSIPMLLVAQAAAVVPVCIKVGTAAVQLQWWPPWWLCCAWVEHPRVHF